MLRCVALRWESAGGGTTGVARLVLAVVRLLATILLLLLRFLFIIFFLFLFVSFPVKILVGFLAGPPYPH